MTKLQYPTCQHIMPSGRLCGCPQKAGIRLCIGHARDHQRLRNLFKAREIKDLSNPKRPEADYRPLDDLNAAIFDSLNIPALEDKESVNIVLSNAVRLLGGGHLSNRAFDGIVKACRVAEVNLRKGNAFFRTDMEPGLTDTDPIKPFGDATGFVLPEENVAHRAHQHLVRDFGADRAHQMRTDLGYNDHMLEPLAENGGSTRPPSSPSGGSTGLQASETYANKERASAPAKDESAA